MIGLGVGIRQSNINISQIREFKIPVPPLDVQNQIISMLHTIHNYVREIIKLQEQTDKEIDILIAAILERAFKRELLQGNVDLSTNEKSVKSQGHSQQITLVDFLAEVSTIEPTKNNMHEF